MTSGDVRNNWALLTGVALISAGGAVVYLIWGERHPAIAVYFLLSSLGLAFFAYRWFKVHRPALRAPPWAYGIVVLGLEVGAFLGGSVAGSRAIGAWLAVGLAFVAYGSLERSRAIISTGAAAVAVAVVVYLTNPGDLGFTLELLTAAVFGVGALVLRGRPRGDH